MDALRNLLLAASSQDPRGLANAENQLKTLEIQPGFHAALLVSQQFSNAIFIIEKNLEKKNFPDFSCRSKSKFRCSFTSHFVPEKWH